MPRRGGLGPQGHTAIRRAARAWQELSKPTPTTTTTTTPTATVRTAPPAHVNPAVTSRSDPGEEEVEAELQWYDFDSSRVNQAAYDAKTKSLFVNFVRPTPGWDEYVYEGVEPNEWKNFRRSQSPGKYINRILNFKDYHRVN